MSKKWLLALGAFALGVGAGIGLKMLLDKKRKSCIECEEDGIMDLVHAPATESECGSDACEENGAQACEAAQESEEARGARIIRETLDAFGIGQDCEVTYVSSSCHIQYKLFCKTAAAVQKIESCADDIRLILGTDLYLYRKSDEPYCVVLEMAKEQRCIPAYDQVKDTSENPLEVPIGTGVTGETVYCNLAKMPHLLMAGTTGSGKSVTTTVILSALAEKNFPEDLRFLLIDPKQIEFEEFANLPYLYAPIVTSPLAAAAALRALVAEMEERFHAMRDASVRNIDTYNEKMADAPEKHMPYIVVAVDELADLTLSEYSEEIEDALLLLAKKGRVAGIHLIVGTQRPTSDVITERLKENMPSRISFMVCDAVSSRIILDMNGAEHLCGRGDMLYMPINSKNPLRVQGTFLSAQTLTRRLDALRAALPEQQFDEDFCALMGEEVQKLREEEEARGEQDALFLDALELVMNEGRVSCVLLQRRLAVGYACAVQMIERMEELGLVSPVDGNKGRTVLPAAKEYWDQLQAEGGEEEEIF